MRKLVTAAALMLGALLAAPAQAVLIVVGTEMTGAAEDPPNASPGTGSAVVVLDTVAHTMTVSADFSGLLAPTTVAHIHCCTTVPGQGIASVATATPSFPGFPAGVNAGSYFHVFDMLALATWRPGFVTANGGTAAGAEAAFIAGVTSGRAYFNIHTTAFPGGEIRGFLVPEPASLTLLALALAGAAVGRRRTRRPST